MYWGRELLKKIILRTCSPQLQQQLRRYYLVRQVLKNRNFHEPEMLMLKSVISLGDSVVDIGANIGIYTKELSLLVGPNGYVYAFEPIPETYIILETVIRRARLTNVHSFRAALGSSSGKRKMVIPDFAGFTGYYWAHFAELGDTGRWSTVEVMALDSFQKLKAVHQIDFIKCDVEGGELEVLRGGTEILSSQCPGWLLEVSRETSRDVFSFFLERGYQGFVYDGALFPTANYRDQEFSNYFFFHPKSKVWDRIRGTIRT
jgi:FkbM family methyltransferase